jgi:hypothetical protein
LYTTSPEDQDHNTTLRLLHLHHHRSLCCSTLADTDDTWNPEVVREEWVAAEWEVAALKQSK